MSQTLTSQRLMSQKMEQTVKPGQLTGTVVIPPSKSDAQRTYLSAALANGTSVISGWGNSDDERAMRAAITQLGARVEVLESGELSISGFGGVGPWNTFADTGLCCF